MFEEKEKMIFSLLPELRQEADFVIIGGYAVNAYVLPRYSIDCDVVVKDISSAKTIALFLESKGFIKRYSKEDFAYSGGFYSFVLKKPLVSFDILISAVEDRITQTIFPAEKLFAFSSKRKVFAKSFPASLLLKVVNPEMLFVMKAISARTTDLRDVFMLSSIALDRKKIAKLFFEFKLPENQKQKILAHAVSKEFRDSLQSIYGKLPEEQFEQTKKKLLRIIESA